MPLPIFATVAEAKHALENDALGTVYYRVGDLGLEVFVATCHGTGTFAARDWTATPDADVSPTESDA